VNGPPALGSAATLLLSPRGVRAMGKLPYVGRMVKLAYLSLVVLEKLLVGRVPPAASIKDLAMIAEQPWGEQNSAAFE